MSWLDLRLLTMLAADLEAIESRPPLGLSLEAAHVALPSHLAASVTSCACPCSLTCKSLGTAKVAAAIFACLYARALALLSACVSSCPLLKRTRSTCAPLVWEGNHTKLDAGTSSM